MRFNRFENSIYRRRQSRENAPTCATFSITDAKVYVPVVTLSTKDHNKLWEQLKTGFKRTIKWNLNYLIDKTFSKVNMLFVLLFESEDEKASFSKC